MPQIHFYVPRDLASKINDKATESGMSTSRYVAEIVKRDLASDWPEGFFDEVAGGWQGKPLERPDQGSVESRDELG
jgi:hypothetical protein